MDTVMRCYVAAIKSMEDDEPGPIEPVARMRGARMMDTGDADVSLAALRDYLKSVGANDRLKGLFAVNLARWDASQGEGWTGATEPHTTNRRATIYQLLELDEDTALIFDLEFPVADDGSDIISTDEFVPWYFESRRTEHEFYWAGYKNLLLSKGWHSKNVAALDSATTKVVERLSDPTRIEPFAAKGLVIGYVQSGKTANFTGVMAKAIDAGYRLVIVLSGTIDLLRKQTQRRLDMELVGMENIFLGVDPDDPELARDIDYYQDPDRVAGKFLTHGFQPSDQGFPDVVRLTRHHADYRSLNAGITALELGKRNKRKPLYDPENLFASDARLAVVKKNASVLKRLVRDLKSIRSQLSQIPTLIIDDESDQASVNTSNPARWKEGQTQRTAINGLISQLLTLLPRAQYVGYTATPYANVFVDPADSEDIFPKDFLLSLDRPAGYMGVGDFHDLDLEPDEEKSIANSNELAFVRNLYSATVRDEDAELLRALDSFVLSGAIKLFRSTIDPSLTFRHHTMLIHETVRTADHRELAQRVRRAWRAAGYHHPDALARLGQLLEDDFAPVSRARGDHELNPVSINDVAPFVGPALDRILEDGSDPVLIVNGDVEVQKYDLDFDRRNIWRILIGGAKLSRGFTVEGLTVSYYRRKASQADTLMQMGRWFGFRPGYGDLVRLYIGREEAHGRTTVDLYKSFEAVVRDEESFRAQLKKYARLIDGVPQCRPKDVPPLVSQHLPTLKPSAPAKMFNAELVVRRTPGEPLEPLAYPATPKSISFNYGMMAPLLDRACEERSLLYPDSPRRNGPPRKGGEFDAMIGVVSAEIFLKALSQLKWLRDDYFEPDLRYYAEITASGEIEDWVLINPQLKGDRLRLPDVSRDRTVYERRRPDSGSGVFGALSDPRHRPSAARIVGAMESSGDKTADSLTRSRRGAALLYPLFEHGEAPATLRVDQVHVAMTLFAPAGALGESRNVIQFRARDKSRPNAPIVDSR